jgi:V/A-type H+-transporting ATPase subunit E
MTGLEKMLEHIKNDADMEAKQIISQAESEVRQILEEAESEGKKSADSIEEQANADYESLIKQGESAAALREKRMILEVKQQVIEEMIEKARKSLVQLPVNEYFETILSMVKKYSLNQEGTLLFSKSDLNRMPKDFEQKLNQALEGKKGAVLKISDSTRPIDGGFVLQYGEIEENCSFEALFLAAKETLQDKAGALLFE